MQHYNYKSRQSCNRSLAVSATLDQGLYTDSVIQGAAETGRCLSVPSGLAGLRCHLPLHGCDILQARAPRKRSNRGANSTSVLCFQDLCSNGLHSCFGGCTDGGSTTLAALVVKEEGRCTAFAGRCMEDSTPKADLHQDGTVKLSKRQLHSWPPALLRAFVEA